MSEEETVKRMIPLTAEEMSHQMHQSALERNHNFRVTILTCLCVAFVAVMILCAVSIGQARALKETQIQQEAELEKMKFRCPGGGSPYPSGSPMPIWPYR